MKMTGGTEGKGWGNEKDGREKDRRWESWLRRKRMAGCVYLHSCCVRFCVQFRITVGDQLEIRVFQEGFFPYFKYCRTESESSLFLF
jgi:hypothetical protein